MKSDFQLVPGLTFTKNYKGEYVALEYSAYSDAFFFPREYKWITREELTQSKIVQISEIDIKVPIGKAIFTKGQLITFLS